MSSRQDVMSVQGTNVSTRRIISGLLSDADNWLLVILGGMAVVFFILTWQYRPAAAFFPRIVSFVVAALCSYELGVNFWTARSAAPKGGEAKPAVQQGLAWYWAFASLLAYFLLISLAGFDVATVAYLFVFPVLVGYRRWVVIAITAVVVTVLVDASFGQFLHVPLPPGLINAWLGR
jgi:hypothetical protein